MTKTPWILAGGAAVIWIVTWAFWIRKQVQAIRAANRSKNGPKAAKLQELDALAKLYLKKSRSRPGT
jgi:uncharacterized membrane protein YciS (DUF1049 family)